MVQAGETTEKSAPEGTAEYQWNGRGELVKAELSDGSTVRYGHDAFGRFMSRDPIRDGWNWYAYVGGDPVNYVDTWGLVATESDGENTSQVLSVAGSVATATGVTASSADFALDQAKGLNTSRTLRNSAGQLMRNTGELMRRAKVKSIAVRASRAVGKSLTKTGVTASVASFGLDTYQALQGNMGAGEWALRTVGNGLSAIPTPLTAGAGLAVTAVSEFTY